MAAATDRKRLRDADRDDAADASRFFSRIGYFVLAVGAPVGVVLHPLGLYVMFSIGVGLDSHRRGARRGTWIFRAFQPAFFRSGFSRLAGGTGLGGVVDSVDALSGRGRSTSPQTGGPARRHNAGCVGAARERGRDRPLSVPDRRDRRHGNTGRARAYRDAERDGGRWRACDWRGRDRGPAFPGDRRSRGARTQRTRAPSFDPRPMLRLHHKLHAAYGGAVRRLPGAVVLNL